MKKIILSFILIFSLSFAVTSCRDTKKADDVEETMDDDDMQDAIDDAADDMEDAIDDATDDDSVESTLEEGANEVQENTGLGGEDDA